jgi:hypothetical protein
MKEQNMTEGSGAAGNKKYKGGRDTDQMSKRVYERCHRGLVGHARHSKEKKDGGGSNE